LWSILGITALAGMGGTGIGGLAACLLRRDSGRAVSLLLSFAAGVMTAVVCFDLLRDAIEPENAAGRSSLSLVIAVVLAGYGSIAGLNGLLSRRSGGSLLSAGVVLAAAIALHNLPEGMVIGASFARSAAAGLMDRSGIVMAGVIGLHNVPEGMAVAVPLISGGMEKGRAVAVTATTGAPTVIGALLGYRLGVLGPTSLAVSLSFASGAMLYVVFGELLPEASRLWRSHVPALAVIAGMMVGLLIVYQ
jgi:ZIP family zinc transporter